jgi:2-polyprenyl-3-methyl-5-hydroxy-6-metoxy-1,4-benzoquinol methylase
MAIDIQQIKKGMKATWEAGDFGQVAARMTKNAEGFVERLNLQPGARVLDVACGSGNLAIPAAKRGCEVTGVDIAANLVEQARARAKQEGVKADFQEGDAEQLQFADNTFDAVITMFGAMFAPRPDVTARELVRVCRPGGLIAMANWTPEGFVGHMFRMNAKFVPPPADVPPPSQWGVPNIVEERLKAAGATSVQTARVMNRFDFPFGPAEVVAFFRQYFGPTQVAFGKLDAAGQAEMTRELEALWAQHNQGSADHTIVDAEYLEVRAKK